MDASILGLKCLLGPECQMGIMHPHAILVMLAPLNRSSMHSQCQAVLRTFPSSLQQWINRPPQDLHQTALLYHDMRLLILVKFQRAPLHHQHRCPIRQIRLVFIQIGSRLWLRPAALCLHRSLPHKTQIVYRSKAVWDDHRLVRNHNNRNSSRFHQ